MNHNGYLAVKLDESWQDVVKRNATMEVVRKFILNTCMFSL